MNRKKKILLLLGACFLVLGGAGVFSGHFFMAPKETRETAFPKYEYTLATSQAVNGRQGVAVQGGSAWISGSGSLAKYDANWELLAVNENPFATGYAQEVNHIGDIDVYNNEIYCGVELFLDGVSKNIQIAIYDGNTLAFNRSFPFAPQSGQEECSGIAVNPDDKTVTLSVWAKGEAGKYLYQYHLETGDYLGKIYMKNAPPFIQGVAYADGDYYITADDGDADRQEPDHLYRMHISPAAQEVLVTQERSFNDVAMQGEIEGLSFDLNEKQFFLLYNQGAKIVNGIPTGFYQGYDEEIHQVYVYDIRERKD